MSVCEFIALDNRTPKTVEGVYLGSIGKCSNANKPVLSEAEGTVHFLGRWQNNRGEKGPLSETVTG